MEREKQILIVNNLNYYSKNNDFTITGNNLNLMKPKLRYCDHIRRKSFEMLNEKAPVKIRTYGLTAKLHKLNGNTEVEPFIS